MKGKCWNCGKLNEQSLDGFFLCDCKKFGLWYLPTVIYEKKKLEAEIEQINEECRE